MTNKPLQHSYTSITLFDQCPEQHRHIYMLKTYKKAPYDPGVDIHKLMEARFRYSQPLPPELAHVEPMAQSLIAQGKPECEVSLGIDRDLKPAKSYDAWLRGKWDVILRWPDRARAFVGDWKSGKIRETADQLEIGALLLFAADAKIEEVHGANLWIGNGKAQLGIPYHFKRTDSRWPKWIARMTTIEKLNPNEPWEMRESALCGWCPVAVCPNYKGA